MLRFQRVSTVAHAGVAADEPATDPARPTAGSSTSNGTIEPSAPSAWNRIGVAIVQLVAGGSAPGGALTSSASTVVATVAGAGS